MRGVLIAKTGRSLLDAIWVGLRLETIKYCYMFRPTLRWLTIEYVGVTEDKCLDLVNIFVLVNFLTYYTPYLEVDVFFCNKQR